MKRTDASSPEAITAYLWATPNSRRAAIMLEELALPYTVVPVNIRAGAQHRPEIRALNPFGKLPILTWREGGELRVLFESGAILLTLAERSGQLLAADGVARATTLSWLMVALTGLAPASGQAHHWTALAAERVPTAIAHAQAAVQRVYALLDARLEHQSWLAGDYSIADIAAFPWVERHCWTGLPIADYPHLHAWLLRVGARPAVQRGMAQPLGVTLD